MLSQSRLREVLDYEPASGIFRWRVPRRGVRVGTVAGCVAPRGYRQISVDHVLYQAHRLAWLYVYGEWPVDQIDHRNGVRDDNRIENLREATNAENGQNQHRPRRSNSCGLLGVWQQKSKRWQALINVDGERHHLGTFDTAEEAHEAYLAAKGKLHPFWAGPADSPAPSPSLPREAS